MKLRAFTLIELLVVIAIIAILAAILFPVFAQAKQAAKGAVAISGAKQMSLGQIMYASDNDDYFSPVVEFDAGWDARPFSFLQQPYMKSWQLLLDPTGPVTTASLNNDNAGVGWQLYGLWGMPPMRAASQNPTGFVFGTQTLGAQFTGGAQWEYDGIGGVANLPNGACNNNYASCGYVNGSQSSLSTTAISSPSDQVMIAQSGTYDFMWALTPGYGDFGNYNDTADNFDLYWGDCVFNTYGCDATICGPIARKRDTDGPSVGFFPAISGGSIISGAGPKELPTGIAVWAGTDGHVSATPWRELMGTTVVTSTGQPAIKAFWPNGS